MSSPTQRSLELLRQRGYHAEVVEHQVPGAKRKKDLFGIADILAIREGEVLAVQTTTASNVSARRRKIEEADSTSYVRDANIGIHIHGWKKMAGRWVCREVDVS